MLSAVVTMVIIHVLEKLGFPPEDSVLLTLENTKILNWKNFPNFVLKIIVKQNKPQERPPGELLWELSHFMISSPTQKLVSLQVSPNIHIQILLTDPRTFSYSINWEKLLKDQSNFPFVIVLLILIRLFLDYVLLLYGEI